MKTKQTKTNEIKFFVVMVWGKENESKELVEIPYIFSSLEKANKFIKQEQKNVGFNYGSWTQKGAYIRNKKGEGFNDWQIIE